MGARAALLRCVIAALAVERAIIVAMLIMIAGTCCGHSIAAERCVMEGAVKHCKSSFGPGTVSTYGTVEGNVNRMVIDDPNTSIQPEKFLIFMGVTLSQLAPRLTPDQRGEAIEKLMMIGARKSKEKLRLGDWDWTATFNDKHLTLGAQRWK